MIHEILAVCFQRFCHGTVALQKIRIAAAVLFLVKREIAKPDKAATKHIVPLRHRRGIRKQLRLRCVRQHAAQPVFRQPFFQPRRVIGTGAGHLHRFVADVRHAPQRLGKVRGCFAKLPQSIQLCTDLHHLSPHTSVRNAAQAASNASSFVAYTKALPTLLSSPFCSRSASPLNTLRCGSTVKSVPPAAT